MTSFYILRLRPVGKINTIPTPPGHKIKSLDMSICGVEVADKLAPLVVGPSTFSERAAMGYLRCYYRIIGRFKTDELQYSDMLR